MNQRISTYRLCRVVLVLSALVYVNACFAQQCTGSVGAPIINETFGAGIDNPGPALATNITNLTYLDGTCPNDGLYTIANFTSDCYSPNWHTVRDHTGDPNGYFMLINASEQPSDFFVQTVSGLCDGTTYQFSAWILNMDSTHGILPNVTFTIETPGGTVLQTYSSGDIPIINTPTWQQYGFFFTTTTGINTVVLRMHNNAPGGDGNDLALDDIQFRPAGAQVLVGTEVGNTTTINLCTATNQNLSFTTAYAGNCYVNIAFQWQESTDTLNWTNIAGATAGAYNPPVLAPGVYYYRVEIAQQGNIGNSSCSVFSNIIKVIYLVIEPVQIAQQATICDGQGYTLPSGKVVTTTGIYNDTLKSSGGCDSIYTMLNLTVVTAKISAINAEICPGGEYVLPSGKTVSAAGIYQDTIRNVLGCDSIRITVMLEIDNVDKGSINGSVCMDSSALIGLGNGASFSDILWNTGAKTVSILVGAGVYTVKATDSIGCNAFDTFNISNYAPPTVTLDQDIVLCTGEPRTIDAGTGYQSYLWSTGGDSETTSITATGRYWVTVKDLNGCPGERYYCCEYGCHPANRFFACRGF